MPVIDNPTSRRAALQCLAYGGAGTLFQTASAKAAGESADVAQSLVTIGVDLTRLNAVGDLQGGLEEAERLLGYEVVRLQPVARLPARG